METRKVKILSLAQIVKIHETLCGGNSTASRLRDKGLLESCVKAPFMAFGNTECFPNIYLKAGCLASGLINGHAFIDGNKRIGIHCMLIFLALNGVNLKYTQEELVDLTMEVAKGNVPVAEIAKWIGEHQI